MKIFRQRMKCCERAGVVSCVAVIPSENRKIEDDTNLMDPSQYGNIQHKDISNIKVIQKHMYARFSFSPFVAK